MGGMNEVAVPMNNRLEIQPVLNGYIVRVGCQTVVFETLEKMMTELGRYFKDPTTVESEYLKKKEKTDAGNPR